MTKAFLLLTCSTALFAALPVVAQAPGQPVPDRYIVQLAPGHDAQKVAARHGVSPSHVFSASVNGFAGRISPGVLKQLAKDSAVRSVTPDRVVSIVQSTAGKPQKGGGGGGGTTVTEIIPAGVTRIGAAPEANLGVTGAGVGVAILDTGIDLQHPDLAANISLSSFGGRFAATGQDDQGHGTHVAGIVAAAKNSAGVVGVAPSAKLYAVKVLGADGSGYDSDIIAGLDWVAANASVVSPNIRVVNMSLGRPGTANDSEPMLTAVRALTQSGVSVVVAAGNDPSLTISQQVPAAYTEVMAIASTTALNGSSGKVGGRVYSIPADTASFFTSDGQGVAVSAPGEDQENVKNGGLIEGVGILSTALGGGTTRMSGTSMASPHAAGVVALMWEQALSQGISLDTAVVRARISGEAARQGVAPLDSPTGSYTFDGAREGILSAPGALGF